MARQMIMKGKFQGAKEMQGEKVFKGEEKDVFTGDHCGGCECELLGPR